MDFIKPKKSKVNSKKINSSRFIENPVLYKNSDNPEITFVIDKLIGKKLIQKFIDQFINKVAFDLKFQILYCFKYKPVESDLKSNLGEYFHKNKIDYSKYIKDWSKVITVGRPIYQMTEGNADLEIEGFYDFIFNKTYFYTPFLKSWVFPVDYLFELLDKDSFKTFFALRQIKECREFKNNPIRIPKIECIIVDNPNEFLNEYKDKKCEVAIDIETSGFDFLTDRIGNITFSFDGRIGYFLRWKDIDKELLDEFFKNKYIIGTNVKFDIKFLWYQGIKSLKIDFDTWNAGHILNEMRSNSLKSHSYYYTYFGGYDRELENYKKRYKNLKNYLEIPESILYKYACMDSIISFQLYKKMNNQIEWIDNNFYDKDNKWKLSDYYYKIVVPSINTFCEMEYNGIYYDWDNLEKISIKLQKEINELKLKIYKELELKESEINLDEIYDIDANEEANDMHTYFKKKKNKKKFNVDSNEKLGILFEKKGWEEIERSKKGIYLVNDDTLNKWVKKGHKEAESILKLHELNTLMKTFIGNKEKGNGYWQYWKKDNKLHPSFGVMTTGSGRNFCRNPNLQNLKTRGYFAKEIRAGFISPNKDWLITDSDMSGFQVFIATVLSGDKELENIFKHYEGDVHSRVASEIFCKDLSFEEFLKVKKQEPYKTYRQKSKAIVFGFLFGSSAFSFAKQSLEPAWSFEECVQYVKDNDLQNTVDHLYNILKENNEKQSMYDSIPNIYEYSYYWGVGVDIRKKFFNTYSGLKIWIDQCIEKGKSLGYTVSKFGAIRRLPELLYKGKDTNQGIYKNLCNKSINTIVQSMEICIINSCITKINNRFKQEGLKSRVFNMIHDSIDCYNHKNELELSRDIIKNIMEENLELYRNIPIRAEGEISYPYAEFGSKFYYKDETEKDPKKQIKDYRFWGFGKHFF